jgi:crotonobetainyl-CoA:carnitine CoA-transferase CaiB-like acyl-CoA transferase
MKIESRSRPDAARFGAREFFDVLHEGHESVLLDFEADRELLHRLVGAADVVLESSRPRALRQLGIDADAEVERGAVWMSITAYGRGVDDEMRVGFGDDVAAGAGLVAWDDGEPLPAGDALADPLTGVTSAAAVVAALTEQQGCLLDVSMHDIASAARALSSASETDPVVLPAKARRVAHPARELGDDTARVRVEFDAWSIGRDFRSAAVLRGEWTAKGGCDA